MVAFTEMPVIHGDQYALAVLSFFTSSCGGLTVGVIHGLLTALITKTTQDVRGIYHQSFYSADG
jgi:NhaP-type Na+/H+ or K+/H+ antiporter